MKRSQTAQSKSLWKELTKDGFPVSLSKFLENQPKWVRRFNSLSNFVHSRREGDHDQVMWDEDEKDSSKQYEFLSLNLKEH